MNNNNNKNGLFRNSLFYIVIFLGIMGALYYVFGNHSNSQSQQIQSSQFVTELKKGNVKSFTMQPSGSTYKVTGVYKKAQKSKETSGLVGFPSSESKVDHFSTNVLTNDSSVAQIKKYAEKNNVKYGAKEEESSSIWIQLLIYVVPLFFFIIFFYMMMGQAGQGGGNGRVMNFGKAKAKPVDKKNNKVRFSDVAGAEEEKQELVEVVEFLRDPHKFLALGAKIPSGVLLEGPPGTGKTSIARSIAEAMHKKYVRICLGGVRDEAEIRGHRKTYVGAMPGRITAALQQAGVSNPLMLLDEIDKTSSDYKGDTSAALLEVLDPEQNSRFMDHYIEVPQDLSEVLFIATANDVQGIPRPLLDRMELIEIAGYTENEKEHIAKEHLIPKQMEENGIEKGKLTIQSAALKKIINNYTKEAGVRNLERTIGQICRKTARLIMEEDKKKVTVTSKNLSDFLGKEHFNYLMANKKDEIGISRGLAWTQVGGDTLQIEVNVMPGKGELMLTGQLGDVMKESAQAGITYIRSIASDYKVEPEFFQENDIHVHIPEGAVPKDGPSAGITMATAILSAIIKKPVRADLAMTGEITLRGRVLPIGGLKEKLLAAKYAKIKEVLVPAENKPDIQELDKEITDGLTITFVSSMKEVLNKALV